MEIPLYVAETGKNIVRVYDTEIVCENMKDTLEQIAWTMGEQAEFAISYPERRKGELKQVLTNILKRSYGEDIDNLKDKLTHRNRQIKELKNKLDIYSNALEKANIKISNFMRDLNQ